MRRKGSGTIVQLPSGKYRALLYDADGTRITLGTYPTWIAADAALQIARARLHAADAPVTGGVTLAEYGVTWLQRRDAQGYRDEDSRWRVHVAGDVIAERPIDTIQPADVRAWVDRLSRRRTRPGYGYTSTARRALSRSTMQNALNLLRASLEQAYQDGRAKINPARGVRLPKRELDARRTTVEPWTWLDEREQSELLAGIHTCERWLVQFAIWTGLRPSEQWALRAADVHADSPHPHIVVRYGSGSDGPTKTRRIRYVPLLPGAADAWQQWLQEASGRIEKTGLAFPSWASDGPRTRPPRCFDATIERLAIVGQTGAPVTWYACRHTFASMLVSGAWGSPWSLEEVKGAMGHSSISITERYAHLAQSALTRAADRIWAAHDQRPAQVRRLKRRGA